MSANEPLEAVKNPRYLPQQNTSDIPPSQPQDGKARPIIQRVFGTPDDTKTIFDSLRNMGICIAMLLGIPRLYDATYYLPPAAKTIAGCFVIGATVALAAANLAWTFQTLKDKSSVIAKVFVLSVGSMIVSVFVWDALRQVPRF
ncbi:hypothetical protein [Pseudomonas protegens]|uniref:hypothetical protein n=1 Tax=Pseudomonas protegens TaxID=380021 RepID=UPI0022808D75|nr:hypothetical protein [Pseudomonas protegens]MCY7264284.1 hypothetical protein [Pseudomonas protegens]